MQSPFRQLCCAQNSGLVESRYDMRNPAAYEPVLRVQSGFTREPTTSPQAHIAPLKRLIVCVGPLLNLELPSWFGEPANLLEDTVCLILPTPKPYALNLLNFAKP